MGEIRQITIRNFKALRSASFELDLANVFVGGNNSGKSTFSRPFILGCRLRNPGV
jgi:predicted ATP-dependent endonuclease of OLD family